jgi:hypothetical protein
MAEMDTLSAPSHPLIESDHVEGTAVYDARAESGSEPSSASSSRNSADMSFML